MALINSTKNAVIEKKIKFATNFFSQAKGLMIESKKNFDCWKSENVGMG